MAMNVNQITAQLARLPDQALRSVAQMHKSDPYIMALVAGESARRKELRTAATPQTPDMQPTVAEQLIASLPEDQGIARLPMQTEFAADGGIVGYADRGLVDESDVNARDILLARQGREPESPYGPSVTERLRQFFGGSSSKPPAASKAMVPTSPTAPAASAEDERRAAAEALRMFPATRGSGIGIGAIPKPTNFYAPENVAKAMETVPKRDTEGGLRALEEQKQALITAREEAQRKYNEGLPKGEVGEEALARYKKEAEAEPARRKEALYMAMIEAGLGMMASSSPYALQGIGEGAMRGVGSYKNAMKDLDSMADTRNKAIDALQQARRAEKQGRAEKALAFENQNAELMAKYGMESWKFLQEQTSLTHEEKLRLALKGLDEAGANQRAYQQMAFQLAMHKDRQASDSTRMLETILRLKAAGKDAAVEQLISSAQMAATGKRDPMAQRKAAADILDKRAKTDPNYAMELQKPGRYEAELNAQMGRMGGAPAAPMGLAVEAGRFE